MIKVYLYTIITTILLFTFHAQAAMIKYEQISQVGSRYEYSYQITNNNIADGIEEFSIYFDYNLYDNLDITGSPSDWDPIVFQLDLELLEDGVADWLTFSEPLSLGETILGFNVAFDFTGDDITQLLQAQSFEIFNADFDVIGSGFTQLSNVPEPGSLVLFSLGLVAYSRFSKKTSNKN